VKLTKSPEIAQVKSIGWAVFSQVLKGAGFIFTRGTTAHNQDGPLKETLPDYPFPYDNSIVKYQLRYEIERMKDLLEDAGATLEHVVKAELHMTNMEDIAIVDELWREYFPVNPPARVIIPVPLVVLPMRIESEFIAVDPNGPYKKEIINFKNVPKPISPESIAVKAGPYLFLSGQMATDYKNGVAPEATINIGMPYHKNQARLETEYIIKNVKEICESAGTSISNLVRRRVHFTDLYDMSVTEDLWSRELGDRMPARTIFKTSGPLPVPDCRVQYDLIAYIP
jgi:enamine deaminase RidA (YjgF/YER057c/UK114 family)